METFHLNLSEVEKISERKRKILLIAGLIFVAFGLISLLFECLNNGSRFINYLSSILILLNGLMFLFQTYPVNLKLLKCYVSISDNLIEFKLWELGKIKQVEWTSINSVLISKSKITFVLHNKSQVILKLNLLSDKSGYKIIDSVKEFSKDKQLDIRMIK